MEKNLKNRAPGHPKADTPPLEHMEAIPAWDDNAVPSVICPHCGRGGAAKVLRRQKSAPHIRDCACRLCGRVFNATPIHGVVPMRWILTSRK